MYSYTLIKFIRILRFFNSIYFLTNMENTQTVFNCSRGVAIFQEVLNAT